MVAYYFTTQYLKTVRLLSFMTSLCSVLMFYQATVNVSQGKLPKFLFLGQWLLSHFSCLCLFLPIGLSVPRDQCMYSQYCTHSLLLKTVLLFIFRDQRAWFSLCFLFVICCGVYHIIYT